MKEYQKDALKSSDLTRLFWLFIFALAACVGAAVYVFGILKYWKG